MLSKMRKYLLAIIALTCLIPTAACDGGPILDWLFRRRRTTVNYPTVTAYYPTVSVAYPTTTSYYPATTTAYYPTSAVAATTVPVAAPTTTVMYGGSSCSSCATPVTTVAQPVAAAPVVCQPITPGYRPIPRTSYRTNWVQKPVTYYRPTTAVNPTTGEAITSYRPCNSYRWTLRRVPTCGLGTSQVVSQPASGCSSCATSVPATTIAPVPATTTVTPATTYPAPPATTVPGAVTRPGTPTPATGAPADTRPSLSPSGTQAPVTSGTGGTTTTQLNRPETTTLRQPLQSAPANATPSSNPRLAPVPDPERTRQSPRQDGDAPQLLSPRNRTAEWPVRRAWSFTPVSWPASPPKQSGLARVATSLELNGPANQPPNGVYDRAVKTASPDRSEPEEVEWQSDGWSTVSW